MSAQKPTEQPRDAAGAHSLHRLVRRFEYPVYEDGDYGFRVRELTAGETMCDAVKGLDDGIVPLVEALTDNGFLTFASCEGGPGHVRDYPWVRVRDDGDPTSTARRLREVMIKLGYGAFHVRFCIHVQPFCDTDWIEVKLLQDVRPYPPNVKVRDGDQPPWMLALSADAGG